MEFKWDDEDIMLEALKFQATLVEEENMENDEVEVEKIEGDDLALLACNIREAREQGVVVGGVLVTEDEHPHELAAELRTKLVEKFKDKVFCDRAWPDPPARGVHGLAQLLLKPGATPVTGRVIHLKGERLEAMKELEEDWKKDWKIEPGSGKWRCAAFLITKKSGKWRGVCDYALTNLQIQPDSYPLPLTEEIVSEQARRAMFTVMDLKDAFHQVPLHEDSRPYTCTSTPIGTKQWRVVFMGLRNGVPIFQRVVEHCLSEVQDIASPYVDDIIIGTMWQGSREATLAAHDRDI